MYNPYDIHSWSKQYREDAWREAQARHRSPLLRADRQPGTRRLVKLVRGSASWLLRGAWLAEH
jgi:hypothetical protein